MGERTTALKVCLEVLKERPMPSIAPMLVLNVNEIDPHHRFSKSVPLQLQVRLHGSGRAPGFNKTGFIRKDVLACKIPMLSRVPLRPVQNRLSTCFASHSTAEVSRGTGKNSARMAGMFQWKDPARLMRPPNARQTKHGFAKTRMGAAFVQDKDSSTGDCEG